MSGDELLTSKNARHNIKNQLSNITLAVEQLKHEIPEQTEDARFYLEMITSSCRKINALLESLS